MTRDELLDKANNDGISSKKYNLIDSIIDTVSENVIIYDCEMKSVSCNRCILRNDKDQCKYGCYDILIEDIGKCAEIYKKIVNTKETYHIEKYIPSRNEFFDIKYKPTFDEFGKVTFILAIIKDITDKKIAEYNYKNKTSLIEELLVFTDNAYVIFSDNSIVHINNALEKLFGLTKHQLIGQNPIKFLHKSHYKIFRRRIKYILKNKIKEITNEYNIIVKGKNYIVEFTSSYYEYLGKPSIIAVIRDVTSIKKSLKIAANMQKNSLQKSFPIKNKVIMESLYFPAKTLSGDFYKLFKVNDDVVIGAFIDVSGKGVSAALSVSAFNILFYEVLSKTEDISEIVRILNIKVEKYFEDNYIAACCFKLDFKRRKMKVIGAGINEFLVQKKGDELKVQEVKGPFLGMFQESIFGEKEYNFESGDRFYFITDGLDFITATDDIIKNYMSEVSLTNFKKFLVDYLNDEYLDTEGLKDDCTMLAIEIK